MDSHPHESTRPGDQRVPAPAAAASGALKMTVLGLAHQNIADGSGRDETFRLGMSGVVAVLESNPQLDTVLPAGLDHALTVRYANGHRFVAQYVLARLGRLDGLLGVQIVRGGDVDRLHRVITQHRGEIIITPSSPMFRCKGAGSS